MVNGNADVQQVRENDIPRDDKNMEIKCYLFRIRESHRRMDLLKRRILLREDGDPDDGATGTEELRKKLEKAEQDTKRLTIRVTDLISRLEDVNQQTVLVKRYVDMKSWEDIGAEMDMPARTIQKLHGKALPVLQDILTSCGEQIGGAV